MRTCLGAGNEQGESCDCCTVIHVLRGKRYLAWRYPTCPRRLQFVRPPFETTCANRRAPRLSRPIRANLLRRLHGAVLSPSLFGRADETAADQDCTYPQAPASKRGTLSNAQQSRQRLTTCRFMLWMRFVKAKNRQRPATSRFNSDARAAPCRRKMGSLSANSRR